MTEGEPRVEGREGGKERIFNEQAPLFLFANNVYRSLARARTHINASKERSKTRVETRNENRIL
jgi:hypothetical protein